MGSGWLPVSCIPHCDTARRSAPDPVGLTSRAGHEVGPEQSEANSSVFAGSSWGRPGEWLSNGFGGRGQTLCSPNIGREEKAPVLQGPAHAQARGYHPAAPLCRVSENFPTPRIPGPSHPKRPPRSSLLTTSQLRNPSEPLPRRCLNWPPQPRPPKTASSLPYKAACSLADLPGLLEGPSLNASRASLTKHKSILRLGRNRALRAPKPQGFSHSPSVMTGGSPNSNPTSELSCPPPQLPSTWPPVPCVQKSGHHTLYRRF